MSVPLDAGSTVGTPARTAATAPVDSRDPSANLLGAVLEIAEVVAETAQAVTLRFAIPPELAQDFAFRPGQFLTLAVPSEETGWAARCYSISSSPGTSGGSGGSDVPGGSTVSVTVKRTEGGYASNWLCDTAEVGSRLRVLPPSGLFVPRSPEADLLLCAAGSGITPVMSILRSVLESVTGRVALFYANRDAASAIFADELAALADVHGDRLEVRHWHSSTDGRVDAHEFARWAAPYREREIFTCGPAEFMDTVRQGARIAGFDTFRIQTEEFRSLTGDPFEPIAQVSEDSLSDASLVDIDLDGEVHTLPWPGTHTLIDIMVVNGIDTPYACREGKCGACTCRLAEGEVAQGRTDALEAEDIADGYVLGCQATPVSKAVRVEF